MPTNCRIVHMAGSALGCISFPVAVTSSSVLDDVSSLDAQTSFIGLPI
jgi:hypothetical protein